jgi:hypothetical protein
MSDEAEVGWRFKVVIEGDVAHINATFNARTIDRFAQKLEALKAILDEPEPAQGMSTRQGEDAASG